MFVFNYQQIKMKIILRYYFSVLTHGFFASIFVCFKMCLFKTTFVDSRFRDSDLGQSLLMYLSFPITVACPSPHLPHWTVSPQRAGLCQLPISSKIATQPVFWKDILSHEPVSVSSHCDTRLPVVRL